MKTKAQKKEQLERGKELLSKSGSLIFADFRGISSEKLRALRRELKTSGTQFFILKKRLLSILLNKKGEGLGLSNPKAAVGTVFSKASLEEASGPVYRFFKELKLEKENILGGFEVASASFVESDRVRFLGQLPPREVLLGQLLGLLSSPIRSFLYVLDQKSKK